MNRRSFLSSLAAAAAAGLFPVRVPAAAPSADSDRLGRLLPLRALGQTGVNVTLLGVGGWHIGKLEEAEAQATIEAALEGGVRFFDTAENYQMGGSERRYGKLLTPKYRDVVFLMSKTAARNADVARKHLDGTLRRLNTDFLDLWQIHGVETPEDVDGRLAKGVLDVAREAKASGKVRHIGFTGHARPSAHLRMLEQTQDLETCQMPINAVDPGYESFVEGVLPKLVERKMGVLAMKTLGNGGFFGRHGSSVRVVPEHLTVEEALTFVWSLPVSVLISGPDNAQQMRENVETARDAATLSEEGRQAILKKVAALPGKEIEYYKS